MPPPDANARKPKALVSRPAWPPSDWAGFLKLCAGASAAAALQLGCPGAQVRPEPRDCPSRAVDAMFNNEDGLNLRPGNLAEIQIDRQQRDFRQVVFTDGPVTGVIKNSSWPALPSGTPISGYLWTGGGIIVARYTEAHLPDGRTLPVCFEIGDSRHPGFLPHSVNSKPGMVVGNNRVPAYAVMRWH
ncbi:hypothetical protein D7V80_35200 [Corallococcus sp. CA054B]|nr:hypothetical protein D7V80_35200 [Corallococcus sp. CA054B]